MLEASDGRTFAALLASVRLSTAARLAGTVAISASTTTLECRSDISLMGGRGRFEGPA